MRVGSATSRRMDRTKAERLTSAMHDLREQVFNARVEGRTIDDGEGCVLGSGRASGVFRRKAKEIANRLVGWQVLRFESGCGRRSGTQMIDGREEREGQTGDGWQE